MTLVPVELTKGHISPESPSSERTSVDSTRDRWRLAPLGLVVVLAVVLLLHAAPWITAGFGESHDGRNAATWGLSSRALREDPIGSRLGGYVGSDWQYANHPPLIIGETALVETIAGEHRIVTRAPAWLGSLVALFLLCWLLLDAGLSPTAVAAGVVSTCGSTMFLVYGTMLDTPITSFPFTLAILFAWQRAWQRRPWPIPIVVALSVLAALAGWQSLVFVALAAASLAYRAMRRERDWSQPLAMGCAAFIGLVATLAWIRWVYGSFTPLLDKEESRTHGAGILTTMHLQLDLLWGLMPTALIIGALGIAFVVCDPRVRALFALGTIAVVGYALVFRGAAEMHDYWNYAALVPLCVAATAGFDYLLRNVSTSRRTLSAVASLLVATCCLTIAATRPTSAQYSIERSIGTVALAHIAQDLPHDNAGPALAYVSVDRALSPWIQYEIGQPGLALHGLGDLERLADEHPDFPVLVILANSNDSAQTHLRANAFAIEGSFALVPASVLQHTQTPTAR